MANPEVAVRPQRSAPPSRRLDAAWSSAPLALRHVRGDLGLRGLAKLGRLHPQLLVELHTGGIEVVLYARFCQGKEILADGDQPSEEAVALSGPLDQICRRRIDLRELLFRCATLGAPLWSFITVVNVTAYLAAPLHIRQPPSWDGLEPKSTQPYREFYEPPQDPSVRGSGDATFLEVPA